VSWIPIKKSIDFYTLTLLLSQQPRYGSVNLMTGYRHRFEKVLSASIVSLFVLSSLLGVITAMPLVAADAGDLTINGPFTISDTYYLDGNLTILSGGTLTINNAELRILSDVMHKHSITVNGKLIMNGGTITTYNDQVDSWPLLTMIVQSGGNVTMTDSTLAFPGSLTMTGSTSKFTMTDSNITKLASLAGIDVTLLTNGIDDADNGPAMIIDDSTFIMYDSSIWALPEGLNLADLQLSGTANLTAVNSYISVDFDDPVSSPTTHNMIMLTEHANAYLYGCTFSGSVGVPADSAISSDTDKKNSVPTAKHAWDNSTMTLSNLYNEGDAVYQILPQRNLAVTTFNITPIPTYDILSVTLVLKYTTGATYTGNRPINYTLGGVTRSTGYTPVANFNGRYCIDLYSKGVDTRTEINSLRISFFNSGNVGAGDVQFDALYLTVVTGPQTYIYRWGDMTVTDMYGIPLNGATVTAKFNSTTWLGGQNVFYYVPGTTQTMQADPPANILSYMGKTAGTYKLTDSQGKADIPYLTDIVYGHDTNDSYLVGTWPNAVSVGSINITATSGSSTSVDAKYNPYPSMGADNTALSANVSIAGVSATSWDNSKYLVVPPNIMLTGNFTHFGDIIVKPAGTLTLQDVTFSVDRNDGDTARATVYSGGTLTIDGSTFGCDQPLELDVKSGGTLRITDSTINSNVAITVHGSATIQIASSTIEGSLTFDSDATLTTEIKDTVFEVAPTFGGSSVVSLVNVSAPAINQGDTSRVNLYRYVTVTILDLTGLALSGTVVNARFQLDSAATVRATGTSDSSGLVPLKLLVCRMNASGGSVITSYYGNYKFNATYNLPPNYYAPEDGLSLATYSAPLEVDNQALTMTIPIAFADLEFGPDNIYTLPSPPTNGTQTTVYAQVHNSGGADVTASFDVVFYYDVIDVPHRIGTYSMPGLDSGATDVAYVTWNDPPANIHTIYVRINPAHTIIERNYANNDDSISIGILTQPDLTISSMYVTYSGTQIPSGGSVPSDRSISVNVFIMNIGNTSVITPTTVILYNGSISAANRIAHTNITTPMSKGDSPIQVVFDLMLPPINVSSVNRVYVAVVNPTVGQGGYFAPISEVNRSNNDESFNLVILDSRPDPMITATGIAVYINTNVELNTVGNNVSYAADIRVVATIVNDGINGVEQVSVSLDINGTGAALGENAIGGNVKYVDLNGTGIAGSSTTVEWDYKVTVRYAGPYKINITLDKEYLTLDDKNRSNNNAWRVVNVTYITPVITVFAGAPPNNVTAGTTITITGEVKYPVTLSPMVGVTVTVQIQNGTGALIGLQQTAVTSSGGIFSVQVTIPADTPAGLYKVVVTVGQTSAEVKQINILSAGTGDWLFIIIIIAIVAAALVFTWMIYRKGIGKLVECGECGSLIPESAKKCPKCGVEFEEDMVKCSECGSWIAANSLECPNCHVRFGTPLEGDKSYEEKMMDQYELTVVSKYREIAKGELGKEYSEESFQSWWAANPGYIAFEDWLQREEERRKQANIITCPVCGTPNPPNSETCNSCGSPLEGGKGGAGGAGGGASTVVIEKRVIRQPVDRKVVPKKVIKKPLDGQQGGQQ
jgi:hypothetical protein